MNDALLDAFRHNSWATSQLIAACRGLSAQQLNAPAAGSFGSIAATFNHIILADARYLWRLSGSAPEWAMADTDAASLDDFDARASESAQNWERFLADPIDTERLIILDEGRYETYPGVLLAQALHHGSAHREQICAILTSYGIEPPDVQVWAYADATGRERERSGKS
jgi:uncharacterized damage-inducible protein DinB